MLAKTDKDIVQRQRTDRVETNRDSTLMELNMIKIEVKLLNFYKLKLQTCQVFKI